ncbi:WD40 repeats protein [Rhizoctonia solani]|uniref:WD40 repeats protein n=1 Tax=Rhizoctonia solani TaxID=456999 RepID=A0A8H7M414_9AGAM|nr:WD40 repeats protein [Rhizoctonia solani]
MPGHSSDETQGLPQSGTQVPPTMPRRGGPISKRSIPNARHVVVVASGKGGVGKSTVSVNLALALAKYGRVGLLDLDIFGPSIPKLMGLEGLGEPELTKSGSLVPLINHGIPCMSMGFLIPQSNDTAIVWRGLMVQKAAQQLLFDVDWRGHNEAENGLDVLVIDMPPGTGDIALTLGQLVQVSDSFIKTTSEMGVPVLGQLPLAPHVSSGGDQGIPAMIQSSADDRKELGEGYSQFLLSLRLGHDPRVCQRFSIHHARRPSTSSPLASSQIQAESPRTPVNSHSGAPFEGREQAAESTFYKRLRIDVSEPVGNVRFLRIEMFVWQHEKACLFDLENPYETPRFIPQGGTWEVADVQWNPHPARSNLICSTSSQKLLIWDLNMPGQNAIMRRLHAHYRAITDINWHSFTPDVLSSCGIDSWIWTWDLVRVRKSDQFLGYALGTVGWIFWWDVLRNLSCVTASATQVKWNRQDPHLLASAHDTSLLIWDDRYGSVPLATIQAHDSRIYGIDWSRKERGAIISCSLDRKIKMWNVNWSSEELPCNGTSKFTPQNEIDTPYPVWRARNLPFGDGVLALPKEERSTWRCLHGMQRRIIQQSMFGEDQEGWTHPLGVPDDREFQLVTWSKDNTLRLWPVDQQLMQECGHVPGSPIQVLMPRRGAINETYQVIPSTVPATPATPSLTAPFTHRSVLANIKTTQLGHLPVRQNGRKKKNPGFMTRGARVNGMDPVTWMSSVKVEREIDSGQNSMFGSRATSIERTSQAAGLARRRSDRSLSRSMDIEAEGEGDAEDLADEITSVSKALGNKVKFVKTDISKKRVCTVTLNGPWGETQSVFIRITFHFPPEYPKSRARSAMPTIDLEKNPEIALKERAYILRNLRKIRLHTRPCLEACLRFLLGVPDIYGRMYGGGVDTDSDSEGEQRQSRSGIVSHLSNHADNVPMPRRCQGVFGPNGELVCFFPAAPVIIRDGRTPSPSTTSRTGTGTGTGSASRIRPFAPSAIVSHALRGLSQLAVDKPTISTNHSKARDAAGILRFSDHLFARTSMSRPRHSDSVNSWNSTNKPAQVAQTHTFVVIKNLTHLIPVDRVLAEKYVILEKNPAALCRANASVAREHSRHDHERDAKNAALRTFDEKKQVSIEDAYKSVQWGYNPLAKQIVKQIYADVAEQKDLQMLAMISIVLLSADIAAGPKVRPLRKDLNSAAPVRISIDYFSLRKRAPRMTPTDSPIWPKSASVANISPASHSLSSSGNSKNSWQSYINNRFRLGSMPDIQAAVSAASKGDSPGSSRAGSAGMRLLNVVASIPVPGGGRLTGQASQPPPANTNDSARRRQSMMSTATLDSSTSGRAPSDLSSGRLSVHFNHTPTDDPPWLLVRRLRSLSTAPRRWRLGIDLRNMTKRICELHIDPSFCTWVDEVSRRPTMVPFIESDAVARHHRHIMAYAELLAQWGLNYKSTEVRKSIPNLQKSKVEATVELRDAGKILAVERSCITCASTSDGLKPFGTCSYDHNWSSSMKCTVCRLPARGLTKPCLICMHVTHMACWKRVHKYVKSCPSGCGCLCNSAQSGFEVNSKDAPSDESMSPPLQPGSGEPSQVTSPDALARDTLHPPWALSKLFAMGYNDGQWREGMGGGMTKEVEASGETMSPRDGTTTAIASDDAQTIMMDDRAHAHGGDSNQGWDHGGYYEDYSGEEYPRDDGAYDRGKRDRGRMVPSELSAHVIFLGLDQEFNEADLTAFLATHHAYPTSVTIIRDRNTASQLAQGYSEDAGRRVKIDYSQSAQPRGPAGNRMHNDGTRDIGNTQAPVVLLRGVDFQATVGEIAEAVRESTGPKCDGLKGARKVMLIRDKQTKASLGFAFVEYVSNTVSRFSTPGATMSAELHPSGFRIGSRAIAASFAHPSSFQPLDNRPPDEYSLVCTQAVGGSETGWCSYWDQTAFAEAQEFQVDQETIAALTAPAAPEAEKKKEKKKEKTKNSAQKLAESTGLTVISDLGDASAPSAVPQLSKPLSLSLNKAGEGDKKVVIGLQKPNNPGVFGTTTPPLTKNRAQIPQNPKSRYGKPTHSCKAKRSWNINKWNNAQGNSDTIPSKPAEASAPVAEELPYGDSNAMTCLLCSRQFKTVEMLKRHSNESELHKTNLGKPELVESAKAKVEAARQAQASTITEEMGWSEGVGLGAGGDGRVNPIETAIYEQGVGIGASKAKEVTNFQGYREMAKDSARERYNATQ